jgi:hypothetical protein
MWPIRIAEWGEFIKIQMQVSDKLKVAKMSFLTKEAHTYCLWIASEPPVQKPVVNDTAKLHLPWNASVQRFLSH